MVPFFHRGTLFSLIIMFKAKYQWKVLSAYSVSGENRVPPNCVPLILACGALEYYSNDTQDYYGTKSTENLVQKVRTLTPYRHQKCPLGWTLWVIQQHRSTIWLSVIWYYFGAPVTQGYCFINMIIKEKECP